MNKKEKYRLQGMAIAVISFFCVIVILYSIFLFFSIEYGGLQNYNNFSKVDGYLKCKNLSVKETAYCLRDFVSTFYNYTIRDDFPKSLENIMENGGDCYDYSLLYEKMAKEIGFYATTKSIWGDDGSGHKFAIIWDRNLTGYCKLDLLFVDCINFS